ncbi:hypothetical protein CDD80_3958 [Ophiocordyceps camponoti-rufipedis]|uniref:Uncharacterized protein n=1 Tax=Ophiocordyceps camponoti-rufipedis TaxID=2004952 RepID=A0A2C5ZCV0_9HYPO|nr:hypothetical protein CDD80_3958 [Ophiocordyceps camponoti-rufipedis]
MQLCQFLLKKPTLSARQKLPATICCISAISGWVMSMTYFAMAADLGWIAVEVEFARGWTGSSDGNPTRQVYWVLLLVDAPVDFILLDVFLVIVEIAAGFVGAVIPSGFKWAF